METQEFILKPRFNFMAKNLIEVLEYYHHRAIQLLSQGWSWDGQYVDYGWGIQVQLKKGDLVYDSIFILKRGQGNLSRWFKERPRNFVTMVGCHAMYNWLCAKNMPHTLATPYDSEAYHQVSVFYGERRAVRSQVPYMNHIDEGLYVLKKLGVRKQVWDAYCLHPIFQADLDLARHWNHPTYRVSDSLVAILTLEYRNIANAYLPKRHIRNLNEIQLSPISEVNQMLIADKIQNRKDFERYHLGRVINSDDLVQYFKNWFTKLEISEDFYQECVNEINEKTGYNSLAGRE